MNKEKLVKEEVIETVDMETSAVRRQEPTLDEQLKIGYLVGVGLNGQFTFQVFGQEKGMVELMGIHEYANNQIKKIFNESQGAGDKITVEVGRAVMLLNQKFDTLLQSLQSPNNKLG